MLQNSVRRDVVMTKLMLYSTLHFPFNVFSITVWTGFYRNVNVFNDFTTNYNRKHIRNITVSRIASCDLIFLLYLCVDLIQATNENRDETQNLESDYCVHQMLSDKRK